MRECSIYTLVHAKELWLKDLHLIRGDPIVERADFSVFSICYERGKPWSFKSTKMYAAIFSFRLLLVVSWASSWTLSFLIYVTWLQIPCLSRSAWSFLGDITYTDEIKHLQKAGTGSISGIVLMPGCEFLQNHLGQLTYKWTLRSYSHHHKGSR